MTNKLGSSNPCPQQAHALGWQVSYAIGVAQPLSVHVDTYGTGTIPDKQILAKVLKKFDFRPGWVPLAELLSFMLVVMADGPIREMQKVAALVWHGICVCALYVLI